MPSLELVRDVPLAHVYQDIPGFFWFEEAYHRLLGTLAHDRLNQWVEIGAFQGRSTAWLIVESANRGIPLALHVVDSFEAWAGDATILRGAALEAAFRTHIAPIAPALRRLGGALAVYPVRSLEAAQRFQDGTLDVVFVDGSHEYHDVLADISAWWPKLKPGGFMAGDDFMMYPVMRAVCEQFAPSGYILCHGWSTNPQPQCWPSWIARKA